MPMTPDQKEFWDILTNDPAVLSHRIGRELYELSKDAKSNDLLNRRADQFLSELMNSSASADTVIRAMTTLLSTYRLPLVPGKMGSFARFSALCYSRIEAESSLPEKTRHLTAYPLPEVNKK